jgi:DNA repair protein SbcC/Rad50
MIPNHLTLQGLYSYQEKQSIDFTKLTESNIFGIFGPVGSGKSAILEAITYALYGKTDRLNLSGDNRYYNMMNLKSNELVIEFVFSVGKDDNRYMATVKSRRNSRQFDDVKAIDHTAYKQVNSEWIPIEVGSLETLIGLSYENFKRTIIIPQGKFQEFLQLGNKERTQMMKELFNLDKFELYYKVVSLETKNNKQIQNLEGQLQQLGEINPDQIKEAETALNSLKREIEIKTNELSVQQEQEGILRKLRELAVHIKETEQTLRQLKEQEPAFNILYKSIKEYEYCQLKFKSLFESAIEISEKVLRLEKSIASDSDLLTKTANQLSELNKSFDTVKKEFEGREIFIQQAEELMKIAKLIELKNSGIELNEKISQSEEVLAQTVEIINYSKLSQDAIRTTIKGLRDQYPDMALLSKIKEWFTINKILISAQSETEHEITGVQKDEETINIQKTQLWLEECFSGIPITSDFKEEMASLEDKRTGLNKIREELSKEVEHLSIQVKLEEYATNLEDGKPCPLCGSLMHPQPLNSQTVTEALANAKNRVLGCEKSMNIIVQNQNKLLEINSRLQSKHDLLEKLRQKQQEHIAKISSHQTLFTWNDYKNENAVSEAFALAEKLKSQINENEGQLEKFTQKFDQETLQKERYSKVIEGFKHQLTANITESSTLLKQMKLLKFKEFENKSLNEINNTKEAYLKKYKEVEAAFQDMSNRLTSLHKDHDNILGRLEANRQTLVQEIDTQKTITERIQEQLIQSQYKSVADVDKILAQALDVEKENKKVADFRQTLVISEKQLEVLKSDMGNQSYDEELHRKFLLSIKQASEELTLMNQNLGKLGSELSKLKADLDALKDMKDRMGSLQVRAEDIRTLKQLFKASGFVNYISTVYLQELCHAANERFYKLTRQKLSLEVTDDNSFQVRDFLNGGKVRNVKTLSGGQTFQAALSLALALADSIQKITGSNENFFFLDEGFGSLDKESLDIVFDTLKSLRKENRIVGVISHVEEMQQEIDVHLKISMDEEKGSLINCSWN